MLPFVMLPSRLFRNTGLAPPLRSLITPHVSLPASASVQLRFRLKVRAYSASTSTAGGPQAQTNSSVSSSSANANDSSPADLSLSAPLSSLSQSSTSHTQRLQTDPLEPRLSITFTCTAPNCSTRSSHTFTKRAYEKGVVIVQCPGCKNRHLIADHLSWFKDSTDGGRLRTVEDIVKARGEKVRRGELKIVDGDEGVLEFAE